MNPLYVKLVTSAARAAIAALGGAALISDSDLEQLIGALALAGSLAWSAWEKYRAHRKGQELV